MTDPGIRVGFIGIGGMDTPMSCNLLKAGFSLTLHHRDAEKAQALASEGANVANSCAEVAEQTDVVITLIGTVESPCLVNKGRMMIEGDFDPTFALNYMQKDFDLIMEAAHTLERRFFPAPSPIRSIRLIT
jgi:3-hydroxyisobutyrate dehydrogenase-like beta-hydroxyacid dehydrogenase